MKERHRSNLSLGLRAVRGRWRDKLNRMDSESLELIKEKNRKAVSLGRAHESILTLTERLALIMKVESFVHLGLAQLISCFCCGWCELLAGFFQTASTPSKTPKARPTRCTLPVIKA